MSIWSSRIVDPGFMTSLMTSSRIIIVGTLGLNILETRPDSGMVPTENLYKLAYGLSIGRASEPCRLPACSNLLLSTAATQLQAMLSAIIVTVGMSVHLLLSSVPHIKTT